jgi:hypothetical protein
LKIQNGVIRDRTPNKKIHEDLEYTKGVMRAVHRRRTHKKSLRIQNEVIRDRTPKKDIHDLLKYTTGVIRGRTLTKNTEEEWKIQKEQSGVVHQRRRDKKSLNIQRSNQEPHTDEGHAQRV